MHGTNLTIGPLAMFQSAVNNELTAVDDFKWLEKTMAELPPEFIDFEDY